MKYYCECCDYGTDHKPNFERHLLSKKHEKSTQNQQKVNIESTQSQQKVNIERSFFINCKYCNKSFTTKQAMYRHIKYTCKKNKDEDLKEFVRLLNEKDKEVNEIKEKMNQQTKENEKLAKQIEKLSKKLQINNYNKNNTTTNCNNNNIMNNYHIQLLNYDKTDYSHLTDKDYVKCIKDCNHSVMSLIKKVHFNDKKPENKNIYISNIKNGYAMVYKDNKWQLVKRKDQIDDMYDYNEVVLDNWYAEYKVKYPNIVKSFQRYLRNKEEGDDMINRVKEQILLMLYNNRYIDEPPHGENGLPIENDDKENIILSDS